MFRPRTEDVNELQSGDQYEIFLVYPQRTMCRPTYKKKQNLEKVQKSFRLAGVQGYINYANPVSLKKTGL